MVNAYLLKAKPTMKVSVVADSSGGLRLIFSPCLTAFVLGVDGGVRGVFFDELASWLYIIAHEH